MVSVLAEEAIQRAVEEVKALPTYASEGEVDVSFGHCMTLVLYVKCMVFYCLI